MDVVRFLADECGPRPAAGPTEERVLEYLTDQLSGIGLDVRRERFAFRSWEASGDWTLTVSYDGSDGQHVPAFRCPTQTPTQRLRSSAPGRQGADDITVFDSTGIGLHDVVTAELAYTKAIEGKAGTWISLDSQGPA